MKAIITLALMLMGLEANAQSRICCIPTQVSANVTCSSSPNVSPCNWITTQAQCTNSVTIVAINSASTSSSGLTGCSATSVSCEWSSSCSTTTSSQKLCCNLNTGVTVPAGPRGCTNGQALTQVSSGNECVRLCVRNGGASGNGNTSNCGP